MLEVIRLGPLLVRVDLIILILSGACSLLWMKFQIKKELKNGEGMLNAIGNAVFIVFAVWKCSYLLFEPFTVLDNPFVLIYFSGGYRGWILGLFTAFLYLSWESKKQHIPLASYFRWLGLGFLIANGIYHFIFLMKEPSTLLHAADFLLSAILFLWIYMEKSNDRAFQGWIWFGILQIFILFFHGQYPILLGLSREQWIYISVSILGFLGQFKFINFKES
ncbi:hypothetical protein [Ammoniphilus sp. YIM 78166]|uniref:hypothetical protein n=1 Tax=Ammoniphilus sp. YIM 78166 TaxID=1644106 RepID=UPI00106F1F06|nr:hypothetical protein [Ammoniphilus sp. YIM 78166]